MAGNGQAIWLACQFDVAACNLGRQAARYLATLNCQAVYSCAADFDKLPFSETTASGLRMRALAAESFRDLSHQLGVEMRLAMSLVELLVGARIAGGIASRPPPVPRPSRGGSSRVRGRGNKATAAAGGPGRWVRVNESMSPRARAYQERITGQKSDFAYEVRGVKFDGYRNGVLLEAKGPGYATFIKKGDFKWFFRGRNSMRVQAERQLAAARGHPIVWRVAEKELAKALRNLFDAHEIRGITVLHAP